MAVDVAAVGARTAAEPRSEACRLFAEDLRRALTELPYEPGRRVSGITVSALGVRDAFTEPAPADDDTSRFALPVHLYGRQVAVGPRPVAGRAGCACCLRRRWQGVRSVALREGLELRGGTRESGPWPYRVPFAAQAVAALIARLAAAPPEEGPFPDVWLVDLDRLTVRRFPLVPEPDCPGCGTPRPVTAGSAALELRPAPKYRPGSAGSGRWTRTASRWTRSPTRTGARSGPPWCRDVTSADHLGHRGLLLQPLRRLPAGDVLGRPRRHLPRQRPDRPAGRAGALRGYARPGPAPSRRGRVPGRPRRRTRSTRARRGLYSDDFHRASPWVRAVRPGPADPLGVGLVAARRPPACWCRRSSPTTTRPASGEPVRPGELQRLCLRRQSGGGGATSG